MEDAEAAEEIRVRSRATEAVTLAIPTQTLDLVRRVAATRDMSPEELLKFYVGQGLRQDAARLFSERILETTAEVLAATSRPRKSDPPSCARSGAKRPPDAASVG